MKKLITLICLMLPMLLSGDIIQKTITRPGDTDLLYFVANGGVMTSAGLFEVRYDGYTSLANVVAELPATVKRHKVVLSPLVQMNPVGLTYDSANFNGFLDWNLDCSVAQDQVLDEEGNQIFPKSILFGGTVIADPE